jgi:DNA polymerase-3 subunit epsilon
MPPPFAMRLSDWRNRLFPSPSWEDAVFWALDLETTGLRPSEDRILSVGMVPIRDGVIRFGERFASMVRPGDAENLSDEGLPAHHLIPTEYNNAPGINDILPEIDRRLGEGILLVHHAPLDVGFLRAAYRRVALEWSPLRVLDTVDLLMALHLRKHRFTPHPPRLRTGLADARRDLGLPEHTQHDALADALATAELFLLLRLRLGIGRLRGFSLRRY